MATRSTIAIKEETGYLWIYSHWNGYPTHNGRILLENYGTEEKVRELLSLGNLSELGTTLETTKFYGRDYRRRNTEAQEAPTEEYQEHPFNYVWSDGQWFVNGRALKDIKRLEEWEKAQEQIYNRSL